MQPNQAKWRVATLALLILLPLIAILLLGPRLSLADLQTMPPPEFIWQTYMPVHDILHQLYNHLDAVGDPAGGWLYVTYWYDKILKINTTTGEIVGTLDVERPEWLALSPDGNYLYATLNLIPDTNVIVIDTASFQVVDNFPTPGLIWDMAAGPNNQLYFNVTGETITDIFVMDMTTGEWVGGPDLPGFGQFLLTTSPTAATLYAATTYVDDQSVDGFFQLDISAATPVLTNSVPLTVETQSLQASPNGDYLLLNDAGHLYLYDPITLTPFRTINLSLSGGSAGITASGDYVFHLYRSTYGGVQTFDAQTGELIYQYESGPQAIGAQLAVALANEQVALIFPELVRILRASEHGVALPLATNNYCGTPFRDDFSNPNSGWPAGQSGTTTYGYQDGQYRIHFQEENQFFAVTNGQTLEGSKLVEAKGQVLNNQPGTWGLVYGINDDWTRFNTFELLPQSQQWFIWVYAASTGWQLAEQGQSGAIQTTGWNTISFRRFSQALTISVNGVSLGNYFSDLPGRVGFAATSLQNQVELRYDDFLSVAPGCPETVPLLTLSNPADFFFAGERPPLENINPR